MYVLCYMHNLPENCKAFAIKLLKHCLGLCMPQLLFGKNAAYATSSRTEVA